MLASTNRVRAAAVGVLAWAVLAGAAAGAEAYKAPRNAFNQPDFSGVWTNASLPTRAPAAGQIAGDHRSEARTRAVVDLNARVGQRPTDRTPPAPTR